ncbi:MAG: hypothetical protein HN420_16695, partial [Rhodospirillaceae bacterium]|nr:hypothetical protein [Rhodospirillaceae bacterium]
ALRKLAGFIAEHGKTAFMVGAGTAGGLAMVSLATKILVVRAALAALRTQAILTGGALTGLGSADAIAQLGGVARWINGISGAAGAAAGPLAGMKAAVHGIGRANVVAGLALVAATMYKIKDATLAAQEAVEKLDGATGEYTNNGFLKALADGARNVGNYYESVFSGKPMAIAGEGSVIKTAPGAERKPRLTAAQKRDRRWAERRAASKAEEEAARKAAWTPEAIEFGTAHGFDPGKDDARQILDMLAVRQRTQAVRDQAALDKGVGKDTVATGVAGRMFSSGNEFADLLRLATDAREAGGGDADLGIRIIQGRAEAEIKAVHETAAAIVKTEKDAAAKIRDQRQAGIEAAERLAKLEREAIGRRGRLYAEQVRTEATQRAEAHRQAEQKAKSEEARRRQRAEDRWEELLNPPSRREQRKTERAGRRRERAKERLVNRAIGKVQDGRAGDLSQREKRALLTRRDEILADRAGKRAKRHRKGAKGAGAQAEDVDRKLAEMGEKQLAERHAIEKRALEAIVAKAEALGGPLGTEAKPDPNVAALARDVERIASMMKQDRTD